MSTPEKILALCAAGAIASIARVGHAPFDLDDPIEITFAHGRVFTIDIGHVSATHLQIDEGALLDVAYGHLRSEEPDTFANIARDWTREDVDLPWVIDQTLTKPRRLSMTQPYRVEVGYVFSCGGRDLAVFGEADLIHIAGFEDPELASYALDIGAPL